MASVTAETKNGKTSYRIAWTDGDKRRRRIRVGGVTKKDAQAIASRVQAIVASQISGRAIDPATAIWISELGDDLHAKLASAGLVEHRTRLTLDEFLTNYLSEHRQEVSERAIANLTITADKLRDHFGADRSLRSITKEDARAWRKALVAYRDGRGKPFAKATVAGHVKRAKQMFSDAVEREYIEKNPFESLKAGSQANPGRTQYIPMETIEKVLEACPDAEWRLLVGLARIAGLRNPSETLQLRWSDINWKENRMVVRSKKTERYEGKASRVVPISPRLRQLLDEAYEQPGAAVYCIERYRSQGVNLRTQLGRIIEKAAVEQWGRLWHNLRASAEMDLAKLLPVHVFSAIIGHSPQVALKHYSTVTEADYDRALDLMVGQQVGQTLAEVGGSDALNPRQKSREKQGFSDFAETIAMPKARPVGFELRQECSGKAAKSENGGPGGGANQIQPGLESPENATLIPHVDSPDQLATMIRDAFADASPWEKARILVDAGELVAAAAVARSAIEEHIRTALAAKGDWGASADRLEARTLFSIAKESGVITQAQRNSLSRRYVRLGAFVHGRRAGDAAGLLVHIVAVEQELGCLDAQEGTDAAQLSEAASE